jgi:hypothetical protein
MADPEPPARAGRCAVSACLTVLLVVVVLAILPNHAFHHSRRLPNEAAAMRSLRLIGEAQRLFRERDQDHGDLQELSNAGLIDAQLGSGEKEGYRFEVRPSSTTPDLLWFAVANPVTPADSGDRYFCTNHEGSIYYTGREGGALTIAEGGDECRVPSRLLRVSK